jgi:hypothetical protein
MRRNLRVLPNGPGNREIPEDGPERSFSPNKIDTSTESKRVILTDLQLPRQVEFRPGRVICSLNTVDRKWHGSTFAQRISVIHQIGQKMKIYRHIDCAISQNKFPNRPENLEFTGNMEYNSHRNIRNMSESIPVDDIFLTEFE